MGTSTDSLTWLALGLALTVAGLLLSVLVWQRKGAGRGLRVAAWSLLPTAAALMGLLRLVAEIGDALGSWASRLVFSPSVWLGVALAGLAVVLWLVGTGLVRRGASRGAAPGATPAVSGAAPYGPAAGAPATGGRRGADPLLEDQDDIEAILRRHGIQ